MLRGRGKLEAAARLLLDGKPGKATEPPRSLGSLQVGCGWARRSFAPQAGLGMARPGAGDHGAEEVRQFVTSMRCRAAVATGLSSALQAGSQALV